MTRFSARDIPTLFGVQILSFPISRAKKCFDRILTTFWGAILIVAQQYDKQMFRFNFDDFSGPGHQRRCQSWKLGPDYHVWHPKHTHTVCGAIFIVSSHKGGNI